MLRCHSPFPKNVTETKTIEKPSVNPFYILLKENIKNVKPKSDCGAPIFKTETYLKPRQFYKDYLRLVELTEDNLTMLWKINYIQRTTGRADTFNQMQNYSKSRIKKRLKQIKEYEQQNIELAKRFMSKSGELPTCRELLQDWKKSLEVIRHSAKHPIVLRELTQEDDLRRESASSNRPMVFLDLAQKDGRPLGKIIIILYNDVVPDLALNFIKLCENAKVKDEQAEKEHKNNKLPHLLGTSVYRIFPGLYLECGDMVHNNGCGGMSMDGEDFFPDNFLVDHDCIGTLAMIPNSEGKVNSLFTISFKPLSVLNGKRAAFGRVVKGLHILDAIQSLGTKNGKPKLHIIITDCGSLKI